MRDPGGAGAREEIDEAVVGRARDLAERVLLPGAEEVEASALLPVERLDALAGAGLYGLLGPRWAGGLEASLATYCCVLEELASGCLTTAFVFAQHHGTVHALAQAGSPLAGELLGPLCRGELRSGVAFGGLRRPGPPQLLAREQEGGVVLEGSAPFVSGWGRVDLVHVAARTEDDRVVWCLLEARESPALRAEPLRLGAVQASGTVALRLLGTEVPPERVTLVEPLEEWRARDARGLRPNGSHALGLARRCLALGGPGPLDAELEQCRDALDAAGPEELPAARARAAGLAWRAAARLVASGGGRSVLVGGPAERLAREASFLLVFGQTAPIRTALLDDLERP